MSDVKNTEKPLAFMGKILERSGTKDGEPWTMFKCQFMTLDKEDNHVVLFHAFSPWKNKKGTALGDLEEGKPYNIAYTEYRKTPDRKPSKTAIGFYHVEGGTEAQKESSPVQNKTEYDELVKKLKEAYLQKSNPDDRGLVHFTGAYFINLAKKYPHMYAEYGVKESERLWKEMSG